MVVKMIGKVTNRDKNQQLIICYHDSREIMVGKGQYQRKLTMGEGEKLV